MTDLERARLTYGIIRDFGWDVLWRSANPIPDDAWPIDIIANAIAAARREGAEEMRASFMEAFGLAQKHQCEAGYLRGAEEMRERAAQTAMDHEAPTTARAILDLPLTPEEPT